MYPLFIPPGRNLHSPRSDRHGSVFVRTLSWRAEPCIETIYYYLFVQSDKKRPDVSQFEGNNMAPWNHVIGVSQWRSSQARTRDVVTLSIHGCADVRSLAPPRLPAELQGRVLSVMRNWYEAIFKDLRSPKPNENLKNPTRLNFDIVVYYGNQLAYANPTTNAGLDRLLKLQSTFVISWKSEWIFIPLNTLQICRLIA